MSVTMGECCKASGDRGDPSVRIDDVRGGDPRMSDNGGEGEDDTYIGESPT